MYPLLSFWRRLLLWGGVAQGGIVTGNFGIAIGSDAKAEKLGVGIGYSASGNQLGVAIGANAKTEGGVSALAIGSKSNVSALSQASTSVSGKSITQNADGRFSVDTVSYDRETLQKNYGKTYGAIAIGLAASSHDMFNTALGGYSTAAAQDTTAIGHGASAAAINSIALGNNSLADRENTLSIGNTGTKRQITNVASGTEDNDAVNVSQLNQYQEQSVKKAAELVNNEAENRTYADKENLKQARQYANKSITNLRHYTDNRFEELKQELDEQDKKFERGLASSAAISGLFQPYSVGKLNMTVGIGGYRDESAVAIGTGYRFNSNIAAKAGVAASTGDSSSVMYNASVDFEW